MIGSGWSYLGSHARRDRTCLRAIMQLGVWHLLCRLCSCRIGGSDSLKGENACKYHVQC
jgi:hypothetical protein